MLHCIATIVWNMELKQITVYSIWWLCCSKYNTVLICLIFSNVIHPSSLIFFFKCNLQENILCYIQSPVICYIWLWLVLFGLVYFLEVWVLGDFYFYWSLVAKKFEKEACDWWFNPLDQQHKSGWGKMEGSAPTSFITITEVPLSMALNPNFSSGDAPCREDQIVAILSGLACEFDQNWKLILVHLFLI